MRRLRQRLARLCLLMCCNNCIPVPMSVNPTRRLVFLSYSTWRFISISSTWRAHSLYVHDAESPALVFSAMVSNDCCVIPGLPSTVFSQFRNPDGPRTRQELQSLSCIVIGSRTVEMQCRGELLLVFIIPPTFSAS